MINQKLICIPYAGGTANIFNSWETFFAPGIEVISIELAGKGRRLHEAFYNDIDEAVEDVFSIIQADLNKVPYIIFGHSMGSKIAYKLCKKIQDIKELSNPMHLFLSGSGAPHTKSPDEDIYHLMEDDELIEKILALGGTSPEFFNHPELVEIFLPALKNDFKLVETAQYEDLNEPLDIDISVLFGIDDKLTEEERIGWQKYTSKKFRIYDFEGGHFFLLDQAKEVSKIITEEFENGQKKRSHLFSKNKT